MSSRPTISIIIPTYNRPVQLAACLESLAQLNYPTEQLEIIVVNDGGEAFDLLETDNLRLISQPNRGPAAARNTGATHAKGAFLAFLDDDCRPEANWLSCLIEQLEKTPEMLVGGRTMNALSANPFAVTSQLLIDYLYDYYSRGADGPLFFASNNFALSARLFADMGGFDMTFPLAAGEDRDFCDRWRHCGRTLAYVPEAVIDHAHHLTARSFWRQHLNYGRGAYHFHQCRRLRHQEKAKMEPASFYLGLVLFPFKVERTGMRRVMTAVLLAVTQLANIAGYFLESQKRSN